MLVSHRHHTLSSDGTFVASHRLIAPSILVRRVTLRGVIQDERLTKVPLGVDRVGPRRRLAVVLQGGIRETVGEAGRETEAAPGDLLVVPEHTPFASRLGDADIIEIEWSRSEIDDGSPMFGGRVHLGARTRALSVALAEALRNARCAASVRPHLEDLLRALGAEGLPFIPDSTKAIADAPADDQLLMDRIDHVLSHLESAPMLVDLGGSRRTLTRAIRQLHERYALLGRGNGQWRALRDTTRLVVASILVTQREASPREIAAAVGYGSVDALDCAFRHASLPAPLAFRRAVFAA